MGKSLFWKGIFYGALAGGALTMLDKSTRESAAAFCRKTANSTAYYVKNPNETFNNVKEFSARMKIAAQQVSEDVAFIAETVEELREAAPQVTTLVENTKSAFKGEKSLHNENEVNEWDKHTEV
ncbi:hypothetical protein [Cytobacillus gottheilii]|uniref:hypothetical protein n=1 Tax=Cytobacillus gottheilii TaxID=859144 RepID=UPI0009BA5B22|nr:hypothetical protein [Cytobacillus gottheilii]